MEKLTSVFGAQLESSIFCLTGRPREFLLFEAIKNKQCPKSLELPDLGPGRV